VNLRLRVKQYVRASRLVNRPAPVRRQEVRRQAHVAMNKAPGARPQLTPHV
jgi:hypothetical protein